MYVIVLFFAVTGAGLITHWPVYVKFFWYNVLVQKWLVGKPALGINTAAPDFTLKNLQGNGVRLKDYHGRPMLIVFWATWCKPCRDEIPMLMALYEQYQKRGLVILAITDEKKWLVEGFLKNEQKIPYTILLDGNETGKKLYKENGIPLSFVVDASGIIRHKKVGYGKDKREETEKEYTGLIEKLLARHRFKRSPSDRLLLLRPLFNFKLKPGSSVCSPALDKRENRE